MKLKRHIDFIKESFDFEDFEFQYESEIQEAKEYLIEKGFTENYDRFDYNGDVNINSFRDVRLVYKGFLLVKFGVINGEFDISGNDIYKNIDFLPTKVTGNLDLSRCGIKSLENFNVDFKSSIDLSQNHLHSLENLPEVVNGNLNLSSNMLTSLEGCPKKAKSFYISHNWIKTLYKAPIKLTEYQEGVSSRWGRSGKPEGSLTDLNYDDKKIPKIEIDFYIKKSFYDGNKNEGINKYYTDLYRYIVDVSTNDNGLDDNKFKDLITHINWPEGFEAERLKTSVVTMNKFNI